MKTKRILTLIAVASLTLFFTGCKHTISFDIHDSTSTVIKSSLAAVGVPFDVPVPPVSTSATQELENQNIKPEWITDVMLTDCKLTITDPTDENFDFLDEIHIYISKSDGSDEQEIAYCTNVPQGQQSIELTTTGVKLDEYLLEDSYNLRTKVEVNKILADDITLQIDLTFNITADVLKLF